MNESGTGKCPRRHALRLTHAQMDEQVENIMPSPIILWAAEGITKTKCGET